MESLEPTLAEAIEDMCDTECVLLNTSFKPLATLEFLPNSTDCERGWEIWKWAWWKHAQLVAIDNGIYSIATGNWARLRND